MTLENFKEGIKKVADKHNIDVDDITPFIMLSLGDPCNVHGFKYVHSEFSHSILAMARKMFGKAFYELSEDEKEKIELERSEYLNTVISDIKVALSLPDDYGPFVEVMEQEGGGEGGAEYRSVVTRFGNNYYRASFSYGSYDGFDYHGIYSSLTEVTPKTISKVVYEPK